MYRALMLIACASTFVMADPPDFKKCMALVKSGKKCCTGLPFKANAAEILASKNDEVEKVKDCAEFRQSNKKCAVEMCISQKLGYATFDGIMDRKLTQDKIETEFGLILEPELVQKIVKNCVTPEISVFIPEEMCDFMKFKFCTDMQILLNCAKWDDDSSCTEMKNLADECKKLWP